MEYMPFDSTVLVFSLLITNYLRQVGTIIIFK